MNRQVEWLNENRYRRYPFVENAVMASTTAGVTVPDTAILDLQVTDYQYAFTALYLTEMVVGASSVTFTFTSELGTGPTYVLEAPVISFPYTATIFAAEQYRAIAVFGNGVADIHANVAPGTYVFDPGPQVEPALISIQNAHRVTQVQAADTSDPHDVLTGIVEFEEGYNCLIVVDPIARSIRLSAISGAGAGVVCEPPVSDTLDCDNVLLRLNGLHGDNFGNFIFAGNNGVEMTPDPDNHRIIIKGMVKLDEIVCKPGPQ